MWIWVVLLVSLISFSINLGMLKATAAKATGPTYVKTLLVVDMVLVDFLKIKVHIRISYGLTILIFS